MKILTIKYLNSMKDVWWWHIDRDDLSINIDPCWSCGELKEEMIRLEKINDGCIDEFLCKDCIKKLAEIPEVN